MSIIHKGHDIAKVIKIGQKVQVIVDEFIGFKTERVVTVDNISDIKNEGFYTETGRRFNFFDRSLSLQILEEPEAIDTCTTIGPADIIKNQDKWLIDQILVNEGQEAVITGVTSEGKYILSSLATQDYLTAEGWKPKIIAIDKPSVDQVINFLEAYINSVLENKPSPIDAAIEMLKKLK